MHSSQNIYSLEDILGNAITREDALSLIIASDANAFRIFKSFPNAEQKKLISFIQGNQGLQIMHDGFAKHVLDPTLHPERLESFLSAVLDEDVKILEVLTRDGCQLSEKGSLVIMEQSSKEFLAVSPHYIHRELHSYDSGAKAVNLFKTIYISLDTFRKISQNVDKKIYSMLHAWLTFFGSDIPADIVKLVNSYPEFLSCYKDITEFRQHPKELITMFSEALAIMDHNTELYMIDEMRKESDELRKESDELRKESDELRNQGKSDEEIRNELGLEELPL